MGDIDRAVLEDLGHRGESLLPEEFVTIVERHHAAGGSDATRATGAGSRTSDDAQTGAGSRTGDDARTGAESRGREPGVPWSLLEAYARRLDEDGWIPMSAENVLDALERQVVDSTDWTGDDAFYAIGENRVSRFPRAWHDELDGETDIERYVAVMEPDVGDETRTGGAGRGVPKPILLDAATIMGGYDRERADDRLHDLFTDGVVEEDTDQHPEARVRLVET